MARTKMKSKEISIIVAFTALATALNLVKIPVPYNPTLSYQIGDIALVVAFLLFGVKPGFAVAFLSMITSMVIIPGPAGLVGPPYYLVAVSSMFFGVYLSSKINKTEKSLQTSTKSAIVLTLLSVLTRTLLMLPLDYFVYGALVSYVSGLSFSVAYALVIAAMPGIILYNITVPLYVMPTSHIISNKITKTLRLHDLSRLPPVATKT